MSRSKTAQQQNSSTDINVRLILFVAGSGPNSRMARRNLDRLCREELHGRADVTIVDVCEDYRTAAAHNVFLTPCLIVLEPGPGAHIVGNLSDAGAVLDALQVGT